MFGKKKTLELENRIKELEKRLSPKDKYNYKTRQMEYYPQVEIHVELLLADIRTLQAQTKKQSALLNELIDYVYSKED